MNLPVSSLAFLMGINNTSVLQIMCGTKLSHVLDLSL